MTWSYQDNLYKQLIPPPPPPPPPPPWRCGFSVASIKALLLPYSHMHMTYSFKIYGSAGNAKQQRSEIKAYLTDLPTVYTPSGQLLQTLQTQEHFISPMLKQKHLASALSQLLLLCSKATEFSVFWHLSYWVLPGLQNYIKSSPLQTILQQVISILSSSRPDITTPVDWA